MRVVVAPDSYKGSLDAASAASAIARGWLLVRPGDRVIECPIADGGDGTLDLLHRCHPDAVVTWEAVTGPDGRRLRAPWLLLADGTAVVELAASSGLPLMQSPDALLAQTIGFGELLRAARSHPGTRRIVATVGGSAATDGGTGALRALGARLYDAHGRDLPYGGGALRLLAAVDSSELAAPPPGGVEVLVDVDSPLLGPRGAAHRFGPQKGATPGDVAGLEAGLAVLARLLATDRTTAAADPDTPGAGAAGGTGYGFMAMWGARLVPGAPTLARMSGLVDLLDDADVVVTGEGKLDAQSLGDKVVGHVMELARRRGVDVLACPGTSELGRGDIAFRDDIVSRDGLADVVADVVALDELAGSGAAAMVEAADWLTRAGSVLALRAGRRRERSRGAAAAVRPGIKDVALAAAVSVGTVSNVLNKPHLVNGRTRVRVEAVIRQVGYVPNEAARQLRACATGRPPGHG